MKISNLIRLPALFLLALGMFASPSSSQSSASNAEPSLQISVSSNQLPAAADQQLAENPLTNSDWNTGLSKPAFRRVRFNERYGGCC